MLANWKMALFGIALALGGAWLVSQAVDRWREVDRLAQYVATTGVVVSSRVEPRMGGRRGVRPGFQPALAYRYSVERASYTGTRISMEGEWSTQAEEIERLLAPYPRGARVTVHYDPASPGDAVLEMQPPDSGHFVAIGLGVCVVLFGLVVLFAARGER